MDIENKAARDWEDFFSVEVSKRLDPQDDVISKSHVQSTSKIHQVNLAGPIPVVYVAHMGNLEFDFKHFIIPGHGEGEDYEPDSEGVQIDIAVTIGDDDYTRSYGHQDEEFFNAPPIGGLGDGVTDAWLMLQLARSPWDHYYSEDLPLSSYVEELSQEYIDSVFPTL